VDHLHRALRLVLSPQVLEQRVHGDRAARLEQQACEQRALPRATKGERLAISADLERPEDEEIGARGATLLLPR
jgi:hypothetical protein